MVSSSLEAATRGPAITGNIDQKPESGRSSPTVTINNALHIVEGGNNCKWRCGYATLSSFLVLLGGVAGAGIGSIAAFKAAACPVAIGCGSGAGIGLLCCVGSTVAMDRARCFQGNGAQDIVTYAAPPDSEPITTQPGPSNPPPSYKDSQAKYGIK